MTQVTKLFGAPGTGKTTTLVGNTDLDLDGLFVEHNEKYGFSDQMLVTYTNAGVDEAVDRLSDLLDLPKKRIKDRVMTIHGHCYRTLDVQWSQMVGWREEKKFCKKQGLSYGNDDDDGDVMTGDGEEGNELLQIYRWLKSNCYEIEEYDEYPGTWDSYKDTETMLKAWEAFKRENDLLDWCDLIERVVARNLDLLKQADVGDATTSDRKAYLESCQGEVQGQAVRGREGFVDTKALYVDECQDLDRLQWLWYLCQKLAAEEVYLAGDDDQTVFEWSGADPNQLLDEEGETEILDTTYRLPTEIWDTCQAVIEQVDKRQEKTVEPVDREGTVEMLQRPRPEEIIQTIADSDDVLVLFRTTYHIDEFRNTMHEYGIPYDNLSTFDTWSQDVTRLRNALRTFINGDELSEKETERIYGNAADHMVEGQPGMAEYAIDEAHTPDELLERFRTDPYNTEEFIRWYCEHVFEHTDNLNYYEKEALVGNLTSSYRDRDPSEVRISTIHSAKGREADTVVVGTDTTRTVVQNMDGTLNDPDDAERRVMYVALSRAKRRLVVAEGIITPSTSLRIKGLVRGDDR